MVSKLAVGVDFGGTNLKAGLIDNEGQLLSFVTRPTVAQLGKNKVIESISEVIQRAIDNSGEKRSGITGVAIGACGLINRKSGTLVSSVIMPTWNSVPLSDLISKRVGLRTIIDNDSNAAVYGEWWVGIGKNQRNLVGMTLGTGIGGGAILNGQLYYGSHDQAGEFGHISVDPDGPQCYCGNRGCLGPTAGASGMVQRFLAQLRKSHSSTLSYRLSKESVAVTAKEIFEAAISGDELAIKVVNETGKYIGMGVATLLSCFNPDMVVLTGGMTGMGDLLLTVIRDEARKRTYPSIFETARIEFGKLEDKAGVIGAAGIFYATARKRKSP